MSEGGQSPCETVPPSSAEWPHLIRTADVGFGPVVTISTVPDPGVTTDAAARLLISVAVALTVVDMTIARGTARSWWIPLLLGAVPIVGAAALRFRIPHALVGVCLASAGATVVLQPSVLAALSSRVSIVPLEAAPAVAEAGVIAVLVMSIVRQEPAETAFAYVVFGVTTLIAAAQLRFYALYTQTTLSVIYAVAIALAVAVGLYLRSIDRSNRLSADLARQQERTELARELHDVVAHHVTAIVVRAQGARLNTTDAATAEVLDEIEQAGAHTLRSMRAMVGALRSTADLRPSASADDIRALASGDGDGAIEVDVRVDERFDDVDPVVQASLYRVALEAISNARRHAVDATKVTLDVSVGPDAVRLHALDDGRPLSDVGAGYGLIGVAERMQQFGGSYRAGWSSAAGWELEATVPIDSDGGPAR